KERQFFIPVVILRIRFVVSLLMGGSCCNIVDQEVVRRFNLKTMPHQQPYTLNWLNSSNPIQVKEQATIQFAIGAYKDEVTCDVLTMTTCHLLLGRPWQFDRGVIHEGVSNEYSFHMAGKRITLHPMSPHEIMADYVARERRKKEGSAAKKMAIGTTGAASNQMLLAKAKEVSYAIRGSQVCFLLIPTSNLLSLNELSDLPKPIIALLQEFKDLFQEEVPSGLPPLRGIEHQIDFIPGSTLPNRAAYRTNPEETKELQRQVEELLQKGYVRESLSPCVVPVILVPKK